MFRSIWYQNNKCFKLVPFRILKWNYHSCKCLCTGNKLSEFLGDQSLSSSIHLLFQILDKFWSIISSCLHSNHSARQLWRIWFLHGSQDLRAQEKRHNRIHNLLWLLLKDHICAQHFLFLVKTGWFNFNTDFTIFSADLKDLIKFIFHSGWLQWQHRSDSWLTIDHWDEVGVNQFNFVHFARVEQVKDFLLDLVGFFLARGAFHREVVDDVSGSFFKVVIGFLSNEKYFWLNTLIS